MKPEIALVLLLIVVIGLSCFVLITRLAKPVLVKLQSWVQENQHRENFVRNLIRFFCMAIVAAVLSQIVTVLLVPWTVTCLLTGMGDGQWVPVGKFLCFIIAVLNFPLVLWGTAGQANSHDWTVTTLEALFSWQPMRLLSPLLFGSLCSLIWTIIRKRQRPQQAP